MSGWEERLDAALGTLSEDDLMYAHPVAMTGVPMDPVLFVNFAALRAALSGSTAPLDVERLGKAIVEHRAKFWANEPCVANCARDIAPIYARLAASPDPAQGGETRG